MQVGMHGGASSYHAAPRQPPSQAVATAQRSAWCSAEQCAHPRVRGHPRLPLGTGHRACHRTRHGMRARRQGGVPRFYHGVGPALLQAPLTRFFDTAANAGLLAVMEDTPAAAGLPLAVKTVGVGEGARQQVDDACVCEMLAW